MRGAVALGTVLAAVGIQVAAGPAGAAGSGGAAGGTTGQPHR
jgi:hypothetical protein